MFGKLMSIADELMPRYYELLTPLTFDRAEHPRTAKEKLAKYIITQYHSAESAESAAENFKNVFANNGIPDNIAVRPSAAFRDLPLAKLLTAAGLSASNAEAKREISSGAVKINGQKAADPQMVLITAQTKNTEFVIQAGKRKFIKLV